MKKLILSLTFLLAARLAFAVEGMWLPLLLGLLNETEMKSLGMKMTAEDIYSVNKGSLKDAIVQCEAVQDYTSRELFRSILDSEEEHIGWLETQLEMISQIGIQNYIQLQSGAAE